MNGIKTVRRTVGTAVALMVLCLLATGCIEELRQGGKVSFTASTGYLDGGVKGETKTFYSGDIQSAEGSRYERINWVTGDLVKIYCDQSLGQESDPTKKSAVYTVTAASSPSGTTDKAAAISPKSPDTDLRWDVSSRKHHFFAAYPSDVGFNTSYYSGQTDLIVMEHSVPAVQVVTQEVTRGTTAEFAPDMTLVAMGAYSAKDPSGPAPTVELTFHPLVTTLRVELLAGDELSKGTNLTMLQLKSSSGISAYPLAGSYKVAIGDYNNHQTLDIFGAGSGSVDKYGNTGFKPFGFSANYAATENAVRIVPQAGTPFDGGVRLNETNPTAFTFVMLPVADMQLTLELTFGGTYDATTQTVTGGTTRSLELKNGGAWWKLGARRKNYLNMVGVRKKSFKVTPLPYSTSPLDWTESNGTEVICADPLDFGKNFNLDSDRLRFRVFSENLGGFETEVKTSSGDTYIGSNSSLVLTPVSETGFNSETDRALTLHFRTSALGSAGTTLGIPSGTFNSNAEFTVNASGDKVHFSPGNLRYQASTTTWAFAPSQHDFIGIASGNTTIDGRETQSDWIDFFRWATSGWDGGTAYTRTTYRPEAIDNTLDAYWPNRTWDLNLVGANAHGDWGVHNSPIDGESWRLLTLAEMEYLFNRPNSFLLAALPSPYPEFTISFKAKDDPNYKVSYIVKKPMICGVILFPDGFDTNLIDASIRGNIGKRNLSDAIYHEVVKNWPELESAGCVFLPEGRAMRDNNGIGGDSGDGFYFTSTASSGHYVGALTFGGAYQGARVSPESWLSVSNTISEINYGGIRVPIAGCVRLVREAGPTPTDLGYTTSGNGTTFIGDSYGADIKINRINYSDGTYKENPDNVTWSTDSPDHLTLSATTGNAIVATPKATAPGAKLAKVIAECEGVQREVYVYIHKIESVTVTTVDPIIYVGGTTLATSTITWTEALASGLTQTRQATVNNITGNWIVTPETGRAGGWKSSNPSLATVSDSGRVRGESSPATGNTAEISYSIRHNNRPENYSNIATGSATITVKTTGDPEAYNVTGNGGIQ